MDVMSGDGISQTNMMQTKQYNVKPIRHEMDIMEATCTKEITSPKIYN